MLESLFLCLRCFATTISRAKKALPDGEGFTYISVTRLLAHVTLDILKERSDQSPLYRKGVGG